MHVADLTLVTYTFNDPDLVCGLLRCEQGWTCRPARIVVVDDGSQPGFEVPWDDQRLEVLRLDTNIGPAGAKATGLGAVSDGLVVSMDCDMRPQDDWLRGAVEKARRPEVGLVGALIEWDPSHGPVSRYLNRFGLDSAGTGMLRGGAWVLRAQTWQQVDGFGGHDSSTHEDVVFSIRVVRAGLELALHDDGLIRQVRRLDRLGLARQKVAYHGKFMKEALERFGVLTTLNPLLDGLAHRLGELSCNNDEFIYLELLCFSSLILNLYESGAIIEYEIQVTREDFVASLHEWLQSTPYIRSVLWADLQALGFELEPGEGHSPGVAFWNAIWDVFSPLSASGAMQRLDHDGLGLLVDEESNSPRDFHYLDRKE